MLVLAIFVVAALSAWRAAAIAASLLAAWYVGCRLFPLFGDFAAYYRGKKSHQEYERLRSRQTLLGYSMLLSLAACAAVVIAGLHTSLPWRGSPGQLVDRSGLPGALVVLVIAAGVVAAIGALRQVRLNHLHAADGLSEWRGGARLASVSRQQGHPFSVYSSSKPFVGSGSRVITWAFAQRLVRRIEGDISTNNPEYETPPFRTQDLIDHLKERLDSLVTDENPETRLAGLVISDHVLIEGTHAHPYLQVLHRNARDPRVYKAIARTIAYSGDAARHYLACQVESWGGEIVTTVFVHLSLQGRTLYLEFSTYALLPTKPEYHVIDEVGETGPAAVMRATWKSIGGLPEALLSLWRLTLAPGDLLTALRVRKDPTATARRGVNIGATVSAREAATAGSNENYFQYRDIFQHSKIIERRIFSSVAEFLEDRDVDTSEFLQRANTILNQGVIIKAGGAVTVTDSAIGNQATAGGGGAPSSNMGE